MRRKALTGPLQHLCLWAVVLLFGAFSALAPGTMPERQQGALTMVLCTGYGVETVTIGPDGEPVQPEHKPCDWNQHSLCHLKVKLSIFFSAFLPTLNSVIRLSTSESHPKL